MFECILNVSINLPGQHIVQVFLTENGERGLRLVLLKSELESELFESLQPTEIENQSGKPSHKLNKKFRIERIKTFIFLLSMLKTPSNMIP